MSASLAPLQPKAHSGGRTLGTGFPLSSSGATTRPGAIRSIELSGPAGRLEAILNEGVADAPFAALVCHPHSLRGGSLHNKVVYHTMKALNDPSFGLGLSVLRFNFRGVGRSSGVHDGEGETGDVLAALDWLQREFRRPVVLAGFSFGAAMALHACCRLPQSAASAPKNPTVGALIALGLPTKIDLPAYRYSFLHEITISKLFLSGDCDEFSTPEQLTQITAAAAEPKRLTFLPGTDHFFSGHLAPMQRAIASWVKEQGQ
jgi:uncharacterized protein